MIIAKTQTGYGIAEQIENGHKIKEYLTEEQLKERYGEFAVKTFEALTSIKDSTQDILDK